MNNTHLPPGIGFSLFSSPRHRPSEFAHPTWSGPRAEWGVQHSSASSRHRGCLTALVPWLLLNKWVYPFRNLSWHTGAFQSSVSPLSHKPIQGASYIQWKELNICLISWQVSLWLNPTEKCNMALFPARRSREMLNSLGRENLVFWKWCQTCCQRCRYFWAPQGRKLLEKNNISWHRLR